MPVLLLSVFLDLVGFGIILPLLPFYAQHYGASPLQVTLLSSTFSVVQMASAAWWGRLSDRHGRRRVILLCLGLSGLAYLWLALAETLTGLFLARALSGFAAGKISVAQAYVADVTPPERRARGMGLIGAAFGVGFIVGPGLGGLLAGGDPVQPNWQLPPLAAAGLSLAGLALAAVILPESLSGATLREARRMPRHRRWLPRPPAAVWGGRLGSLIVLFLMVSFVFSQVETIFPLWAEHTFGWGPLEVGIAFTGVGVLIAGMQGGLIGPLTRRFGEIRLTLGGLVALLGGLGLVPLVQEVWLFIASMTLLALGIAVTNTSMTSLASHLAPPHSQGATIGTANAAASLGRVLGPALGGWLFSAAGPTAPYMVGAILMAGAIVLAALRLPDRTGSPPVSGR